MPEFNPNAVGRQHQWGTFVEDRNPQWREHRRKSDAVNAFNRATKAVLYNWRSSNLGGYEWIEVQRKAPAPPKPAPKPAPDLNFKTNRQRELMRLILERFTEFDKRGQAYYGLEGMSTSHLTLKAIGDMKTLYAFWPNTQIKHDHRYGNIYMLESDTLTQVQSDIRQEVENLEKQGYIERLGNEHERRWRPIKALKGVTL